MATVRSSGVEWTDYSGNAWIGCTEAGPGCSACYARAMMADRLRLVEWGPGKPRYKVKGFPHKVSKANKEARKASERRKFFINPHSDLFDNEVPADWRDEVFSAMKTAGTLDFIMVTKRIGNALKMLPDDWGPGYSNAWLLATMVNQMEVDRDMPKLARIPAIVRGLSIEPILGEIDLTAHLHLLDWVIIGGQSAQIGGEQPVIAQYQWVRNLIDQCRAADIAVYFKQWGTGSGVRGGHLVDGVAIKQFPLTQQRRCLQCGCHDLHACLDDTGMGCHWMDATTCNVCRREEMSNVRTA